MSFKSSSSLARVILSSLMRSSPTSTSTSTVPLPFPLPPPAFANGPPFLFFLAAAALAAAASCFSLSFSNNASASAPLPNPAAFLSTLVGSAKVLTKALYPFKVELTAIQGESDLYRFPQAYKRGEESRWKRVTCVEVRPAGGRTR